MTIAVEPSRPHRLAAAARPIAVAATAGLAVGALIGGIGGRLAMLALRLTSAPTLHGLDTDDGFTIGIVSGETMFLVTLTALLGVLAGLAYLLARAWVPRRWRAVVSGTLAGVIGGSQVIRPGGIDFTLLDPLWLAVVLFVLIPVAYGVLVSILVERWLAHPRAFDGVPSIVAGAVLPLLPFVLLGPPGRLILLVVCLAVTVKMRLPRLERLVSSRPVVWIGRAGLAAAAFAGAVALVGDVVEIL